MALAVNEIRTSRLPTHPASPVRNSQPAGIGRLTAVNGVLVINNLGRNIEISAPDGGALVPLHVYRETIFPHDDEPSQFDLDIHAFLALAGGRQLISINHYGIVRLLTPGGLGSASASASAGEPVELVSPLNMKWPGDAERFVPAGSAILSSSPRGYAVDDGAEPGILVSDPWDRAVGCAALNPGKKFGEIEVHQMRYRTALPDWGVITALAVSPCGRLLAVAAGTRSGVFRLSYDEQGDVCIERLLWDRRLPCAVSWLHFSEDCGDLLAGGCSPSADDDNGAEWETLAGGSLACFDRDSGESRWLRELEVDLAWGNGGDPLAYIPGKMLVAGVDRAGALSLWNAFDGGLLAATRAPSRESMGIAHMACLNGTIYCGFNRGGYYIFRYMLAN